jgi:hypothetical protein
MQNVQNAKQRSELLENEILKIDNELFELEKKYGEFNIKQGKLVDTPVKSNDRNSSMKLENAVNESLEAEETVEEVKELTTETKWGAPIENSQLQIPTYDEQPYQQTELAVEEDQPPKRSKSEI